MGNIGLVISGGGGKGAYFIGVWKALREYGVERNIKDISGTSVGALNAVLFAQGNYEIAKHIWENINKADILNVDINNILFGLFKLGISKSIIGYTIPMLTHSYGSGIFSREGLLKIIDENIDFKYITSSNKRVYATAYDIANFRAEYFELNNQSYTNFKNILLASSALPVIFQAQRVEGKYYYDGGLTDNIPIKPLYDRGIRNFIVVHLSRDSLIKKDNFKNANIIEIVPSCDQGNLVTGTLDFSQESSKRRMQQGYNDTVKMLKPIYEMGVVQAQISNELNNIKNSNNEFNIKRKEILDERKKLKKELMNYL